MTTAVFDTLMYSKKLRAVGVSEEQAEVQAETLAEVIDEKIATKQNIKELKHEIDLKIAGLKSELIKWVLGIITGQSVLMMSFIALLKFWH